MKAIEIKNEEQLTEFMDNCWRLHDGVVSMVTYVSGSRGNSKGTYPFDSIAKVVVNIEGCHWKDKYIDKIQLIFRHATECKIFPIPIDYITNIYESVIKFEDGLIKFFTDTNESKANTYVFAKKSFYKVIEKNGTASDRIRTVRNNI